ncbi:MAG: hypothetical protein RL268_2212, partial [Pseudomonadota bacterium]
MKLGHQTAKCAVTVQKHGQGQIEGFASNAQRLALD